MTHTISADNLRKFSQAAFEASGINPDDAARATDVLIWASLRGVDTHGIRNLKRYYIDSAAGVGRRDGVIIPNAPLTTEHESATAAALNANGGLGLSVSSHAMDLTIDKAREAGVGIVTVRNSTHFGPAGYYAHMAVEHDMLGFAATGYFFPHGQEKAVVPFGGLLGMFSTNPIAMACPGAEFPPFILDMSTSLVPVNRIEMLEELGKRIPLSWALNRDHQPTDDPADFTKVVPLGGATEYGGHKGHGLMIAGWILTGLLSGAWCRNPTPDRVLGTSSEPKNGFAQEGIGHIFAAVRLDQFGDPDLIKRGLDSMMQTLNDSPPAPEFAQVLSPGQKEHATLLERSRAGIPLSGSPLADLRSLAEEFGIPLELND
ncbi:MAG: Ldh family oxidoreductase [Planctomycetota bacterium]|jgi:LDH2 family malate/lactate/ureidoglycolate dehydrogenase